MCVCVCAWGYLMEQRKLNTKEEITNAVSSHINSLWGNYMNELNPDLSAFHFLSPPLYLPLHPSLSLTIFSGLLSQSNFVGVHTLECVSVILPGQYKERDGEKPPLPLPPPDKLLFTVSLFPLARSSYCCAASPAAMVTCIQK